MHTVSGGSSSLIRIMRPCLSLRRARALDELRDQCRFVGRAAVEVLIHANPPRQGSARRRQASRRPRRGRSAPKKRPGQITRCASIAWRHTVSAVFWMQYSRWSIPVVAWILGCDATVVTARTAATRSSISTVSYLSRSANLLAAGRLPERGAPPSSKTRGTSPRGPAESPVAAPGTRLRLSQRAFSGTHAQFQYWADNSSKQAGAWIFGDFASMTRSTTWVMEMRFVTRCTTKASLR